MKVHHIKNLQDKLAIVENDIRYLNDNIKFSKINIKMWEENKVELEREINDLTDIITSIINRERDQNTLSELKTGITKQTNIIEFSEQIYNE